MKIGIDASRYNNQSATGVELYSVKIIQGLIEYFKHSTEHSLILYMPNKIPLYKTKTIQHRVIPMKRLWTVVRFSLEMLLKKPDVLFVPSHVLPYFAPKKSVIMIHDTAFVHFKKAYSFFQYRYLIKSTKHAVKKASDILVPSEATKKDLKKYFKCPDEKITVIPHGSDFKPKHFNSEFENGIFEKLNVRRKDNFFLFIGRLETKKNIDRLVNAFITFQETFKNWKLVLAGKRGVGFEKFLKKLVKKHDHQELFEKIIMPGYITETEKHVLLKYCDALVFPSLYEGFGFPILEAYSYEKPVITAKSSSIPEVAGDAAIYVDPHNTDSLLEGLTKLIKKPDLREKLIVKAREQRSKFNWEDAIKKTVNILLK